jgi:hypothetical protein
MSKEILVKVYPLITRVNVLYINKGGDIRRAFFKVYKENRGLY